MSRMSCSSKSRLERLRQHQDTALAIMRGGEALLRDPSRDTAALARARWALMRVLGAYQLFKHREIFDPAIAGTVLGDARRAARMKAACTAIGEDFKGYVAKWSGTDVLAQWHLYQPAALKMIEQLRSHIARERAEITALLEN